MLFINRMTRETGAPTPVWRYLQNKIADTALITLALAALGLPLFTAAYTAAAIYLVASKIVVRFQQHDWSTVWRDGAFYRRLIFIAVLLALVPTLASVGIYGRTRMLEALGVWLVLLLLLDHCEMEGI